MSSKTTSIDRSSFHHHIDRDSVLSIGSVETADYRGILNQCAVLLILSTGRIVIENLITYGLLIRVEPLLSALSAGRWLLLLLFVNTFLLLGFFAQTRLSKLSRTLKYTIDFLNLALLLATPPIAINLTDRYETPMHPVTCVFVLSIYVICWMKLVSFICVEESLPPAPISLHSVLKSFYYFIVAPTLCYERAYVRRSSRRLWFIVKRVVEVVFLASLLVVMVKEQWIMPIVESCTTDDKLHLALLLTRLALPGHILWITAFYWVFHACLNLNAEILRFADRNFYSDWWNCRDLATFWRKWNMPVHLFVKQHIFVPVRKATGGNTRIAVIASFAVSAAFHEYVSTVSLRAYGFGEFGGMFVAMFVQPFIDQLIKSILPPKNKGQAANIVLWLAVIFGQPIVALLYMRAYYRKHKI